MTDMSDKRAEPNENASPDSATQKLKIPEPAVADTDVRNSRDDPSNLASAKPVEKPLQSVPPNPAPPENKKPAAKPEPTAKPVTKKPAPKPKLVISPLATSAQRKKRHWGLMIAFIVIVLLPVSITWWYLADRAVPQYASTIAFTVRSEDASSAADLLGGLGSSFGGGGDTKDSDILYEFIRSQALVQKIDADLNLRTYYSDYVDSDPIFGFDPAGTIEDLTAYWKRMVRISYDSGSGLMELRVLAFDAQEARRIANAIYENSTDMVNNLSIIAREDATRYAREDLEISVERLKEARESLTAFRIQNELVDPTADIEGQMGLLNLLQSQLVEALIEYDLLVSSTRDSDPRLEQASRRIEVIEERIRQERQKFGAGGGDTQTESYAETIAEFESLTVDREFSEQGYAAALTSFDVARADANRKSRYLAAYIEPTLAERSQFPNKPLLIGVVAIFAFLSWAIMALIYYALRDRR